MRTNQSNKKVNKVKTTKTMVKKVSTKVKDFTPGFTNEIYKVIQVGRTFAMLTTQNQPVTKLAGVSKQTMKKAMDENKAIQAFIGKTGKLSYKLVEMDEFKKHSSTINDEACDSVQEAFETIKSVAFALSWFTPITNIGASADGAEIITFLAPPVI